MEGAPLLSLALNYTVEKPSCQRPSPDFSDCHKTIPFRKALLCISTPRTFVVPLRTSAFLVKTEIDSPAPSAYNQTRKDNGVFRGQSLPRKRRCLFN